jgi:hypothetical protein
VISLEELARLWNAFFHAPEPVATLCVFRIALGTLLTFNAACLLPFADDIFGPAGIFDTTSFLHAYRTRRLTVFYLFPRSRQLALGMVVALVVLSIALTLGIFTRITTPLAWLCLVSLHHRNPAVFNSGDTVQRLLLLLLCFTPSGAALSVDAWWHGENIFQAARDQMFDPWALRLMQLQVSIIYVRTVYWKLQGKTWRNGTAIAYAIGLFDFKRCPAPSILFSPIVTRMFTWGTLVAEVFVGLGAWVSQFRWAAIIMGWVLHLGIDTFLNVHLFSLTMCVALVVFIPPHELGIFLSQW